MLTRPYEVTRVISYVFGSKDDGYSTSLDAITGGLGNVMSIDQRDYDVQNGREQKSLLQMLAQLWQVWVTHLSCCG